MALPFGQRIKFSIINQICCDLTIPKTLGIFVSTIFYVNNLYIFPNSPGFYPGNLMKTNFHSFNYIILSLTFLYNNQCGNEFNGEIVFEYEHISKIFQFENKSTGENLAMVLILFSYTPIQHKCAKMKLPA